MKSETPATTAKRLQKCITPRYRRLILALLTGPLHRETVDRVTGASNGPHYVRQLKEKFRLNIATDRVERVDRDGQKTRPGIYTLAANSIELAEMLCEEMHRNGEA